MDIPEEDRALIASGAKTWIALMAVIVGLLNPVAGIGIGLSKDVLEFAGSVRDRRSRRAYERLTRLVTNLDRRVKLIEDQSHNDDTVDLFVEVVRKAVDDDESRKECFYSGVLEWVLRSRPSSARVRALSDAVRQLSFLELAYFRLEMDSQYVRQLVDEELSESLVISRLVGSGLSSSGVRINGSPTVLGRVIEQYCHVADVIEVLTIQERRRIGLSQ